MVGKVFTKRVKSSTSSLRKVKQNISTGCPEIFWFQKFCFARCILELRKCIDHVTEHMISIAITCIWEYIHMGSAKGNYGCGIAKDCILLGYLADLRL